MMCGVMRRRNVGSSLFQGYIMTNSRNTKPKAYCFILMPFTEDFDDVYRLGIKDACTRAGAYCERVDEQIFHERILDRIYNQIAKADLIIADMTGRNPNVFYEVGYAHALGKLTILLTQSSDDIPFDLKHFPHIVYGTKISALRVELEKRVKHFISNPPSKPSDMKLGLELFLADQNLASGEASYVFPKTKIPAPEITIFNASSDTFAPGDFKIGIITGGKLDSCRNNLIRTTKLPNGGFLHMLPEFSVLFPSVYTSYQIPLEPNSPNYLKAGEEDSIIVRLYTRQGNWDFPISLRRGD